MAKFPTYEEMGKKVAEKALDEYIYKDKTLREWIDILGQTQWIPLSERLPDIQQVVLLSLRSLDVEVGFRAETEPYFYCHNADSCYINSQNVLAWMPLPEPYKESE